MSPLLSGGPLVWVCSLQVQQWNKLRTLPWCAEELSSCTLRCPHHPQLEWFDTGGLTLVVPALCKAAQRNQRESPNAKPARNNQSESSSLFPPVGWTKWDAHHLLIPIVKFTVESLCRRWGVELNISPVLSTSVETTAEKELWKFSQLQSF